MRLQGVKLAGTNRKSLGGWLLSEPHSVRRSTLVAGPVMRKNLILYFLLSPSFLPSYLLARLKSYALSHSFPDAPRNSWQRRCWVILDRAEAGGRWFELLGWVAFLFDGRWVGQSRRIALPAHGVRADILTWSLDGSGCGWYHPRRSVRWHAWSATSS